MVAYKQNELVSSTEISKQFGDYISKIKDGTLEKIGILKNNKLNAVILSVKEYEELSELKELLEDLELYNSIKDRINDKEENYIDSEIVLKKYGLSLE